MRKRSVWVEIAGLAVLVAFLLALFYVVNVGGQAGVILTDGIRYNVSAQTIASNGSGTAASGSVTVLKSYVALNCQDPDGCTITISETGARDGMVLTITNINNTSTCSDSSGVSELNGSFAASQYESLTLVYRSDRWVEQARTINATAASTSTFTNKTYDAEGTGNTLTVPFKMSWEAAICQNATAITAWSTPTSNPAVAACQTGSNTQYGTLDFADGANTLSAQRVFKLPSDWSGALDVQIYWFTSATTGSVVWQVSTICVNNAETTDPSFNTASTVTDAALGTTLQLNTASITGITTTGCAAGELMYLRVFRDPANGSDTLAATARLVTTELTYRRAM